MSSLQISPSVSGGSLGGGTVVGASDLQQALRDGSLSSYVDLAGIHTGVDFPTPSIPPGSVIKVIFAELTLASVDDPALDDVAGASSTLRNNIPDIEGAQDIVVNWATPLTTISYASGDRDANGAVTDWEFDLKNQAGAGRLLRIYTLRLVINYVHKPIVTVANPTGTITNTSFPLVTWNVDEDTEGGAVDQAQVRIFSAAQYGALGFDPASSAATAASGVIDNSDADKDVPHNWRSTTKLPNATYRAYVRTRQFPESNWSDFDYSQFTVNVVAPADPSSVTVTPDAANARMKIDVVGSDSPRSVDAVEIERSEDGGTTWIPVRPFGEPYIGINPISGEVVAYDFEAPNGRAVIYRARTLHLYALGEWAASGWVQSSAATWTSMSWWLKSATDWTLNVKVIPYSLPTINRSARQASFEVPGRTAPVVVSDSVRGSDTGNVVLLVDDVDDQDDVDALLDTRQPLLLQGTPNDRWRDRWLMLGDQERTRGIDKSFGKVVLDTYPWVEVLRPDGIYTSIPVSVGDPSHLYPSESLYPSETLYPH